MKRKLRIGILLYSKQVDKWMYEAIKPIIDSNYASVELVIMDDRPVPKSSILTKIRNNIPFLFYRIYEKIDRRIFKSSNDAFETMDLDDFIQNATTIHVSPVQKGKLDYFNEADINEIKSHSIDILLRMGFNILRGEILNSAKYGIWSYHHGDNHVNRGTPPGFWEIRESQKQTGSILQILSQDLDNGRVLNRTFTSTDRISINRNRNNIYWESAPVLNNKIKELYTIGEEKFIEKVNKENNDFNIYSNRLYKTPRNIEMLSFVMTKWPAYIYYKLGNLLFENQWILLYSLKDKGNAFSFWKYKKIVAPKNRFYADPHVLKEGNKYYVYIEEYVNETSKGHISCIEIDEKGKYSEPVKVLDTEYHLSYPYVFEHKGEKYLIPESSENKKVELHKCKEFPYKWEFVKYLKEDFEALDVTPIYYNEMWWIFTAQKSFPHTSSENQLFLYFTKDLFNDNWISHPSNPIRTDVRGSRPAGKIFESNGKLYRPGQNALNHYGYGFEVFEILTLSENEYIERRVSSVQPDWSDRIKGTHTFNKEGNLTVIDALYRRSKI